MAATSASLVARTREKYGKIDILDYGIIDSNIRVKGAQIPTAAPTAVGLVGVTAVPEPSGLLVCGAGALLAARRRRPRG